MKDFSAWRDSGALELLFGVPMMESCNHNALSSFCPSACEGNLSKTCTVDGWMPSSMDSYTVDCGYNPNNTVEENSVSIETC